MCSTYIAQLIYKGDYSCSFCAQLLNANAEGRLSLSLVNSKPGLAKIFVFEILITVWNSLAVYTATRIIKCVFIQNHIFRPIVKVFVCAGVRIPAFQGMTVPIPFGHFMKFGCQNFHDLWWLFSDAKFCSLECRTQRVQNVVHMRNQFGSRVFIRGRPGPQNNICWAKLLSEDVCCRERDLPTLTEEPHWNFSSAKRLYNCNCVGRIQGFIWVWGPWWVVSTAVVSVGMCRLWATDSKHRGNQTND